MTITHEAEKHRFVAYGDDGKRMGAIAYSPRDDESILATHTVVEKEFQGYGVGRDLLDALASYARDNSLKIIPLCGFVIAEFERNPSRYHEVIQDD